MTGLVLALGAEPGWAWWLVMAFAVLVAAVGRAWWRDIEARRRAEERADRAWQRVQAANQRAADAERSARDWMAEAEGRAADHQNHLHRCLGERVTAGSERCN